MEYTAEYYDERTRKVVSIDLVKTPIVIVEGGEDQERSDFMEVLSSRVRRHGTQLFHSKTLPREKTEGFSLYINSRDSNSYSEYYERQISNYLRSYLEEAKDYRLSQCDIPYSFCTFRLQRLENSKAWEATESYLNYVVENERNDTFAFLGSSDSLPMELPPEKTFIVPYSRFHRDGAIESPYLPIEAIDYLRRNPCPLNRTVLKDKTGLPYSEVNRAVEQLWLLGVLVEQDGEAICDERARRRL